MVDDICTSSLKNGVLFDVDSHVDVSGFNSGILITFPMENVVMRIRNSFFDGNL